MPRERAQGGGALLCAGRVAADGLRAAHVLLRRRGQRQLEPVHGVTHQSGKGSRRDSGSISFGQRACFKSTYRAGPVQGEDMKRNPEMGEIAIQPVPAQTADLSISGLHFMSLPCTLRLMWTESNPQGFPRLGFDPVLCMFEILFVAISAIRVRRLFGIRTFKQQLCNTGHG